MIDFKAQREKVRKQKLESLAADERNRQAQIKEIDLMTFIDQEKQRQNQI